MIHLECFFSLCLLNCPLHLYILCLCLLIDRRWLKRNAPLHFNEPRFNGARISIDLNWQIHFFFFSQIRIKMNWKFTSIACNGNRRTQRAYECMCVCPHETYCLFLIPTRCDSSFSSYLPKRSVCKRTLARSFHNKMAIKFVLWILYLLKTNAYTHNYIKTQLRVASKNSTSK